MLAVDVRRHGIDGETHIVRTVPRQGAAAAGNIAYRTRICHLFPCCGRSERLGVEHRVAQIAEQRQPFAVDALAARRE